MWAGPTLAKLFAAKPFIYTKPYEEPQNVDSPRKTTLGPADLGTPGILRAHPEY